MKKKKKSINIYEWYNLDKDFHSDDSFDIYECFPSNVVREIIETYKIPFVYKWFSVFWVRVNYMTSVIVWWYEDPEKIDFVKLKYYKVYLTPFQLEKIMMKMKECFEMELKK